MSDFWGEPAHNVDDDDPLVQQIIAIARREIDRRAVYSTRIYFNSDPSDDKLVTVAHLERAIRKAFADRTIPSFPAYFFQKDWLVTYDWWADRNRQLENRITALHQRIAELERPWWKRWFR